MTTELYDLPTVDWSVQGWDAVMATAMEKLDAVIPTRIKGTLGETVTQYSALYLALSGKFLKAKADGANQPCIGLTLLGGNLNDQIRIQRMGLIENLSWNWGTLGQPIYLSDTVAGGLTQTMPASNVEIVGYAFSATKMLIISGLGVGTQIFSRGGTVLSPSGAINIIVWRTPFVCRVTAVKGYRVGGTGATINARKNGSLNHLGTNLSLSSADEWMDGGTVQNINYSVGDKLEICLASLSGSPTQIAIQVDFNLGSLALS